MKKIPTFCLVLCLLFSLCGVSSKARAAEADASVTSGCHSVNAASPLSEEGKLLDTAKAAIVYELNSDTMIYTWNPDAKIYPSSMVKLMTALLALENGKLSDPVSVTKKALSYVKIGSVSAGLKPGEELTLEDLLYCMMTASANDAACVIAEHIGGSVEAFITMMNDRAAALGCTGTHYSNVHGLHDEQTYTTARDVCRLLDYALDNKDFSAMFSAKAYTVPATNMSDARQVLTSNYMMSQETVKKYFDARVTGGKTGATDEAGRCLAATAEGNGMKLLTIVMGAEPEYEENGLALKSFGSFEETKVLLDYTLEHFQYRQIFLPGQIVSQFPVTGGSCSVATQPGKEASTVLPVELNPGQLTWINNDPTGVLNAPVEQGQSIASVQVWYGAKCLAQVELVAANAVPVQTTQPAPVQIQEPEEETDWRPLGIAVGILLGVGILAFGGAALFRMARRAAANARRRRRRANRRRSR